jgi:hypothetical protein
MTKAQMRRKGWMLRMTEWVEGYQCAAFHRSHPQRWAVISAWRNREADAWAEVAAGVKAKDAERLAAERTMKPGTGGGTTP